MGHEDSIPHTSLQFHSTWNVARVTRAFVFTGMALQLPAEISCRYPDSAPLFINVKYTRSGMHSHGVYFVLQTTKVNRVGENDGRTLSLFLSLSLIVA